MICRFKCTYTFFNLYIPKTSTAYRRLRRGSGWIKESVRKTGKPQFTVAEKLCLATYSLALVLLQASVPVSELKHFLKQQQFEQFAVFLSADVLLNIQTD